MTQTPCSNSRPCPDGGPCLEYGGTYLCTCQTGVADLDHKDFYPPYGRPDPCSSSPCLNGGTCFHYIGKYKCECSGAFSGRHCDISRGPAHSTADLDCGPPLQVKHAELQFSSTSPGSMALYACHPGYTPMPRATQSICGGQGAWSQPPVCQGLYTVTHNTCVNVCVRACVVLRVFHWSSL
uniref:Sushi domain-containing protein n=1 Tax=Hucho hucho TaxID=62062 RepID=A0A4W5MBT9_9TELE